MFKVLLSLLAVVFIGASAQAAEQVYQSLMPTQGQGEMNAKLGFINGKFSGTTSGIAFDGTTKLSAYGIDYHYGFMANQSLGIEATYSTSQTDVNILATASTTKTSGLNNLILRYKLLYDLQGPSIFFNAGYSFGLEKSKYDNTKNEGNAASAQNSLNLDLGVYAPISTDFKLGGHLGYNKKLDGEQTETTAGVDTKVTVTKGDVATLGVFVEVNNNFHPNFSLSHINYYSRESKSGAITTTSTGLDYYQLEASARFEVAPGAYIIPSLTYAILGDKSVYDKFDLTGVSIIGRFLF